MSTPSTPSGPPVLDLDERPWAAYAACRDADASLFFSAVESEVAAAVRICNGCPVRQECLEWALDVRAPYGVWGGMTERERRRALRRSA